MAVVTLAEKKHAEEHSLQGMRRSVPAPWSQYDIEAWPYEPFERDFSSCALRSVSLAGHEVAADSHAAGNDLRYGEATVKRPALGHQAGTQQID